MPLNAQITQLFPLVPRDRCTQEECMSGCKGTVFGSFLAQRVKPNDASESCACGHLYWQHYLTRDALRRTPDMLNLSSVVRAYCAETGCGGFLPQESTTNMNLHMTCICGAPYLQHVQDIPDTPPTASAPMPSTAVIQQSQNPPAPVQIPSASFGPTRPETPLAAVRTVNTRFPFVPPVASSLSASQQRQLAAVRHRTSSFARGQSNDGTTAPSTPKSSWKMTAATLPFRLKCAIIPFANKTEKKTDSDSSPHPSNMFRFSVTQRNELLYHLAKQDLVIEVNRPNESETAWSALDNQITRHLQANNIAIQTPKEVTDCPYLNIWWCLCHPSRTNKPGMSNYLPHIPSEYDFTFDYLQTKVAWPDPIQQGYGVFFVAPVKTNLQGPSPDSNDPKPHPCWPWRVVTPLHDWLEIDEDYQPNPCIAECSDDLENQASEVSISHGDDDDYIPMEPTSLRKRHLPVTVNPRPQQRLHIKSPGPSQPPIPSSSSMVRSQRAVPLQPPIPSSSRLPLTQRSGPSQPPIPSTSRASQTLFLPDESSSEDSDDPSTPPSITSLPQLSDSLQERQINQWQLCVQTETHILRASTPHITGPNFHAVATVIINALKSLAEETPLPDTLEVTVSHINNLYSLFVSHPTFRVGKTSGVGLTRTVYREALQMSVESDRWIPSTNKGYHILHLPANVYLDNRDQTKDFQVEGNLAALYLLHLAVGPDPISPFVIFAASINSLDEFNFDINFARATIHDQETLNKIECIMNLRPDQSVNGDWLVQLAEDVQVQYPHITGQRPFHVHQKMQKQMLATILVGHRDPWAHPYFKAFKDGFNCLAWRPFLKASLFNQTYQPSSHDNQHPYLPWDEDRYLQRFLSTVYNRRIDDPEVIVPLIHWHVANHKHPLTSTLCNLFIMRFRRWLSGIGHPRAMKNAQITSKQYSQGQSDRGLRARLFHQTVTGSKLRLLGRDVDRIIHVCSITEEEVQFSVCTNTLTIKINKAVANLLVQPGTLDLTVDDKEVCTDFDKWWHTQMIISEDFNDY
ncbi:hypothetical protein F5887DRAFT_1069801 [Amanita rubescens]|nr:hypothetical protein F5887DRAFT_1069801 [Amanita rubescens]